VVTRKNSRSQVEISEHAAGSFAQSWRPHHQILGKNEEILIESLDLTVRTRKTEDARTACGAQQLKTTNSRKMKTATNQPTPMKSKVLIKITARKFKAAIKLNPAWASHLTEPIEITGYCNMSDSKITHLSPLLHFAGKNTKGDAASFSCCKSLKVAEGHFKGVVCFSHSGITQIRNLTTSADSESNAAYFNECKDLKVAEGTFPGCVSFSGSGVKKVRKLAITEANCDGTKANFCGCKVRLPAEFLGPEYEMDPSTRQNIVERIAVSKAQKAQPDLEI
jgi:hypothetical protein